MHLSMDSQPLLMFLQSSVKQSLALLRVSHWLHPSIQLLGWGPSNWRTFVSKRLLSMAIAWFGALDKQLLLRQSIAHKQSWADSFCCFSRFVKEKPKLKTYRTYFFLIYKSKTILILRFHKGYTSPTLYLTCLFPNVILYKFSLSST